MKKRDVGTVAACGPGYWDWDLSIIKTIPIQDGDKLQSEPAFRRRLVQSAACDPSDIN